MLANLPNDHANDTRIKIISHTYERTHRHTCINVHRSISAVFVHFVKWPFSHVFFYFSAWIITLDQSAACVHCRFMLLSHSLPFPFHRAQWQLKNDNWRMSVFSETCYPNDGEKERKRTANMITTNKQQFHCIDDICKSCHIFIVWWIHCMLAACQFVCVIKRPSSLNAIRL